MVSPPLEGASHTVGGIIRGRAIGNIFNHGDAQDLPSQPIVVKGTLKVYTSLQAPPSQVKPTMILKVIPFPTLAPVLKKLSSHYPTVKSKSDILCIIVIHRLLANNQYIYVSESDLWCSKGQYAASVEDDDEIEWTYENGVPTLTMCIVSNLFAN